MRANRRARRLGLDDRGDVTGLPLMLLILVVIAGVGLAVILAWTGKIGGGPSAIGTATFARGNLNNEVTEVTITDPGIDKTARQTIVKFYVKAFGDDGSLVEGAVVSITGSVADPKTATTGNGAQEGIATFDNVVVQLPPQTMTGEIKAKVEKSGWTPYETTLIVRRA